MTGKLYRATEWDGCWEQVALPWFQSLLSDRSFLEKPSCVLVPSPAWGHNIRARLAAHSVGLMGTGIFIPPTFRGRLMDTFAPGMALLDHATAHLTLSAVASRRKSRIASAIVTDPSSLWNEIERFGVVGGKWENAFKGEVREIIEESFKIWTSSGFYPSWEIDREILANAKSQIFDRLLLFGFDSKYWNLWPLLRAAAQASEETSVCLINPSETEGQAGIIWHNSWEEYLGTCEECAPREKETSYINLLQKMDGFDGDVPTCKVQFYVGKNAASQASAVVSQAIIYLSSEGHNGNLGIVVPGRGSLAREIGVQLEKLQIPHFDAVGHALPVASDFDEWRAFLSWCQYPTITGFIKLLRRSPDILERWGLELKKIEKLADRCLTEYLLDEFEVLESMLLQEGKEELRKIGETLSKLQILPEESTFESFCTHFISNLECLGWSARTNFVKSAMDRYVKFRPITCTQELFIRWLDEIATGYKGARYPSGSHPFAKIQIVTYEDARGKEWDYLILAGQNQGGWPPRENDAYWISEESIQRHNVSVLTQGKHGEGFDVVRGTTGIYWDQRASQRHLESIPRLLLENVRHGITLCWSQFDEGAGERELLPSDFIGKVYQALYGSPVDTAIIARLASHTEMFIKSFEKTFSEKEKQDKGIAKTKQAFDARRSEGVPFGIYEFTLEKTPSVPIEIACKDFEALVKSPASFWLKTFLDVKPIQDWAVFDSWSKTKGTWCHRWLNHALNPQGTEGWVPVPQGYKFTKNILSEASAFESCVNMLLKEWGKKLPQYWKSIFIESQRIAQDLASEVGDLKGWAYAHPEWNLPKNLAYQTPSGLRLRLKGRMDLLLAREIQEDTSNLLPESLWLVDYKTGKSTKKLSSKKIDEGTGLQVALYLLALSCMGNRNAIASLARFQGELEEELSMEECLARNDLWEALAKIEARGMMGMRGRVNSEYSFEEPLPMATLFPEYNLVEEKWSLTHGGVLK